MIKPLKLIPLTANEIKPKGWLKRQLEIQAKGLSGNLCNIWPYIRDSSWIGGPVEDWERVPYWLDGYIPLAYLLDDDNMKATAKRYIDGILKMQDEIKWICPCKTEERDKYDIWPVFLLCKVLVMYYECSKDERIEQAVYNILKQTFEHVKRNTLFNWAATRWYECLYAIIWLYERCKEQWLLDLAYLLEAEGVDFRILYEHFEFKRLEVDRYWSQINHVVNTAMALKSRALMSRLTGENPDKFAQKMYSKVMKYNSMPTGHFTGDECLAGDDPIRGSECCSVVEAMFSYETLISITGNPFWGDLLERVAYNAFPATISSDMWTHQYVQLTNQVQCSVVDDSVVPFNSNSGEAHIFGLEPNFGCCTANFNQGWPKLTLSTIMRTDKGLAITVLAPVEANVIIDGKMVHIEVNTDYPFRDTVNVKVVVPEPVIFDLNIRIPKFAKEAIVNNKAVPVGKFYRISQQWEGKKSVVIEFDFESELVERPNNMFALNRGPLLFSIPIKERWEKREYTRNGVERKFPYCDYEVFPESEWNYAFCDKNFKTLFANISDFPFSSTEPPVKIAAKMVPIKWKMTNGFCDLQPTDLTPQGKARILYLQPYGCTNLRMTEMPFVSMVK